MKINNINTSLFLALVFILLGSLCSCEDDDNQEEEKTPENPIGAFCCLDERVTYDTLDVQIYIPNAFSPNNDGINDLFFPYVKSVTQIAAFRIYDLDNLIHDRSNISPNDWQDWAWAGPDTLPNSGDNVRFDYELEILSMNGDRIELEGTVVALNCGPNDPVCQQSLACFFADQYSENSGQVDPNVMTNETCYSN